MERFERWRDAVTQRLRQNSFKETLPRLCKSARGCSIKGVLDLSLFLVHVGINRFHCELLHGRSQTQLELRLCGSVQLLVDGGIVTVERNVSAGRVGEAVESDFVFWRDGKEEAKLQL